jgi:ABC-2 type transport system ATP-binding protein
MRALDYLVFFGQLYGLDSNDCHRRSLRLLDEFGLGEYRYRRVAHYSRGMLQKLALARALLHEPPVLLLDEPTSSLDPESAVLVRDAIEELRSSERTIVICTHNLAEAEILADQIAIIRDGRIIAQGSIEKLKTAWLGLPEYKVQLAEAYPTDQVQIPGALEITAWGPDWLHFRPRHAALENPLLLKSLLDQGLPVMGVVEVPRSLEQVYLEVMNGVSETGENHVA